MIKTGSRVVCTGTFARIAKLCLSCVARSIGLTILFLLFLTPLAYGKQITVAQDSSGDYRTIQTAIDAASSGDTVYVKPGTYEEHINFKSGITLQGAGREVTTIRYSGDNSVLTAKNVTSGTIDGFSFTHRGHEEQCAVRLIASSLTLSNNIIAGAPADGIVISGAGNVVVESNIIRDNGNSGIWAYDMVEGIIRNNEISGSKKYEGIAVYDQCSLYILSNTVWGNARDGIRISDSTGVVWGNEIYDNGDEGVDVRGTATPLIEKNTVWKNAGEGVGLWGQARATVRGNDVYENGDDGINTAYESKPLVEYNRVYSNNDDGIVVGWPSQPEIRYNDVFGNRNAGISIWGPRLHYDDLLFSDLESADYHLNVVHSRELNQHFGVLLVKTSEGRLAALFITFSNDNPCTMRIEEGSLYQVSGTLFRSLKDVSLENHGSCNLDATGKADLLFLCSSSANSYRIEATNDAAFALPTQQVNGLGPIPSGLPMVKNNTVVSNPDNGILVGYGAKPLVEYNVLVSNKWDGVDTTISGWVGGTFGPDGQPELSYNNVWGSKQNYEGLAKPLSDICADPLFVDLENGDFRLTASSPCIDVSPDGTTLGAHPYHNQPPIATFDESPDVNDKQCVTFEAFDSHDPDGFLASYEWDFDQDGTIDAEGITVFYVFPAPGSYTIELTVTDNTGATDSVTHKITVQSSAEPPVAHFRFSPSTPAQLDPIQFADTSTDSDGTISTWKWDFGDKTTSTERNATHRYAREGTFIVRLTITDNDGLTDETTRTIIIEQRDLIQADFTFHVVDEALHKFHLDASSSIDTMGTIVRYEWDWDGDGVYDTAVQTPAMIHRFEGEGPYQVILTIVDDQGNRASCTKEVRP